MGALGDNEGKVNKNCTLYLFSLSLSSVQHDLSDGKLDMKTIMMRMTMWCEIKKAMQYMNALSRHLPPFLWVKSYTKTGSKANGDNVLSKHTRHKKLYAAAATTTMALAMATAIRKKNLDYTKAQIARIAHKAKNSWNKKEQAREWQRSEGENEHKRSFCSAQCFHTYPVLVLLLQAFLCLYIFSYIGEFPHASSYAYI